MKRLVQSAAAAIAMFGGAASAADLLARQPPAPGFVVAPAFSWTGFYVGAHAGYMWTDHETALAAVHPGGLFALDVRNQTLATKVGSDGDGAMGGVQAGYNVQVGGLVVGLEADVSLMDVNAKGTYSARDLFWFPGVMTHSTFRTDLDTLGTLRLRAGVALDRALFYATGGLAVGEVNNVFAVNIPGFYANGWSSSSTEWGWAAGAGVEYALWGNLSAKVEYLYYDLGDRTIHYTDPQSFGPDEWIDYKFKHQGSLARAGVNYQF